MNLLFPFNNNNNNIDNNKVDIYINYLIKL